MIRLDIQLTVMNGVEVAQVIRELYKAKKIKCHFIAVTAFAMKGDRERIIASGIDDYLSKPFKRAQLIEAIEKANA